MDLFFFGFINVISLLFLILILLLLMYKKSRQHETRK